ncbi:MAG: PTS IIA-like nitrogen regulatory protein PtsN [Sulfuriflexus sp.]|nr:PTS IIA-like nitrogen regulatory protein PtsN [Sulfuriflexus sp.]
MNIIDILSPDCIANTVNVSSKKRVLEKLVELTTKKNPDLIEEEIFESLVSRERLGSTGIGHGVAIPHGRVQTGGKSIGVFLQLQSAIDFDAIDGKPVDLVFGLLVPKDSTDEHLEILAKLATLFSDEMICDKIRQAKTPAEIHALITDWQATVE